MQNPFSSQPDLVRKSSNLFCGFPAAGRPIPWVAPPQAPSTRRAACGGGALGEVLGAEGGHGGGGRLRGGHGLGLHWPRGVGPGVGVGVGWAGGEGGGLGGGRLGVGGGGGRGGVGDGGGGLQMFPKTSKADSLHNEAGVGNDDCHKY